MVTPQAEDAAASDRPAVGVAPNSDAAVRRGFFRSHLFATDHKTVALQFLFTSMIFLIVGGLLAMAMRWQLAWPGSEFPILGKLSQRFIEQGGVMPPDVYAEFFSQHGTIMVFFVVIPLLVNGFGNYLIPLHIGAREMAFPLLNFISYWMFLAGGLIVLASFFSTGGAGAAGWTGYPPLSVTTGNGQNLWIIGLLLAGASAVMGAINHVTTILNLRAPGMKLHRMPLFVWAMLVTGAMTLLAIPALAAALLMLLLDRTLETSFFMPGSGVLAGTPLPHTGGGQPLLWQHLFWFYAHPAVYIMILPAMGMVSEILPVFARKPLFGYRALAYSSVAIGVLGFSVWGHHMFQSGMNPLLGTTFMIATFTIAVPSGVKTFNWLGTLWGGSIQLKTPMLHAAAFVGMFAIGGLSGLFLASTPVNVFVHDTYFVVAHLHYVLFGGSLFAIFGGLTYWFPKFFGRLMHDSVGRLHFILTLIAFNGVFFPMHILGAGGMVRRLYDPTIYAHLRPLQPINVFMTENAFVLGIAQLLLVMNVFFSILRLNNVLTRSVMVIVGAFCAAAFAPVIDLVVAGIGFEQNAVRLAGIVFNAPWISITAGVILALAAGWYLFRSREIFGAEPGYNPWRANTLEWQIPSPAPLQNFDEIPTIHHGAYEYSSPHDVESDFLPQNTPLDCAPGLAEMGDRQFS